MSRRRPAIVILSLLAAGCGGPSLPRPAADAEPRAYIPLGRNALGYAEYLRTRDGMPVVLVPAGAYPRRPYERSAMTLAPVATDVPAFLIDRYEVTNARFAAFLEATRTTERAGVWGSDRPIVREHPRGLRRDGARWLPQEGYDSHPTVGVTGWGALLYARWAEASLPTEDQWMKAAGGPEGMEFPCMGGAGPAQGRDERRCNWLWAGEGGTAAVGIHTEAISAVGCLDMAGNVYERVWAGRDGAAIGAPPSPSPDGPEPDVQPRCIKGGSWVTAHPLNLRVLDRCGQPMDAADGSVGFRCAVPVDLLDDPLPLPLDSPSPAAEPAPAREPLPAPPTARLRLAEALGDGLLEAYHRNCVLLLSLHFDTCGACDRTRCETFVDPALVAHLNDACVTVIGQAPGDALDRPHVPGPDDACPLWPGLTCSGHRWIFDEGIALVGSFRMSPGCFVVDPRSILGDPAYPAVLVPEDRFPKSGDAAAVFLARLRDAQAALGPSLSRADYIAIRDALDAVANHGGPPARDRLKTLLAGRDDRIPLVLDARALLAR